MAVEFPRLLGDIGGTNARWAWQASAGAALSHVQSTPCAQSPSLLSSAQSYLRKYSLPAPQAAAVGVATAISGDLVQFTNGPWSFSIADLQKQLDVERCLVINDFTALALSLTELGSDDVDQIGGGQPVPGAPKALLGPGTGLGVSGLVPGGGVWTALSGEGGHVTLAAVDALEIEVVAGLARRFGHASAERALSGPGLVNLYEAVCEVHGVAASTLQPAQVSQAAIEGDAQARAAIALFSSFLGNVSGNLVLTLGARGGLYIGGGIIPQMGSLFDAALFRSRFESKGRFDRYLQPIPAFLITAANPALTGASRALDLDASAQAQV